MKPKAKDIKKLDEIVNQIESLTNSYNDLATEIDYNHRIGIQWGYSNRDDVLECPEDYGYDNKEDIKRLRKITNEEYMSEYSETGWFPSSC